jgi:hypothetical protein
MTQIPAVDLGSGAAMPMVGFGTWPLGGRRADEAGRYDPALQPADRRWRWRC